MEKKETKTLIASARKRAQLTQSELAQLAGVSRAAIALWETGRNVPTEAALHRLMDAGVLSAPEAQIICDNRPGRKPGRKPKLSSDRLQAEAVITALEHQGKLHGFSLLTQDTEKFIALCAKIAMLSTLRTETAERRTLLGLAMLDATEIIQNALQESSGVERKEADEWQMLRNAASHI